MDPSNYFLPYGYQHRTNKTVEHDDRGYTDGQQKEVYEFAAQIAKLHKLTSVCDIGCGSGWKLMHHFSHLQTLGFEISPTYEWLCETYPDRDWMHGERVPLPFLRKVDLVIASDVIEHLVDPNGMLNFICGIKPAWVVLSTDDRGMKPRSCRTNPPGNAAHIREWSFCEFEGYISQSFEVVEHFISNQTQHTQVILATPKTRKAG